MHRRRHRRRPLETPDLDVTPFMNLMIVLVPVLLLSMVFVHTTVIDLNFPSPADRSAIAEPQQEDVYLEVRIEPEALVVADERGVIRTLPAEAGLQDVAALSELMLELKQRFPAKRDATILLAPETDYQTLVFVMDSVRARRLETGDEVELFPELSLGDSPSRGPS